MGRTLVGKIAIIALAAAFAHSAPTIPPGFGEPDPGDPRVNIEQVLERHQDQLMATPGVTGVGIGEKDGKPAIIVMVREVTRDLKLRLPQVIEGHPVVIEQSGEIFAF